MDAGEEVRQIDVDGLLSDTSHALDLCPLMCTYRFFAQSREITLISRYTRKLPRPCSPDLPSRSSDAASRSQGSLTAQAFLRCSKSLPTQSTTTHLVKGVDQSVHDASAVGVWKIIERRRYGSALLGTFD
jgi:hypothetical protein